MLLSVSALMEGTLLDLGWRSSRNNARTFNAQGNDIFCLLYYKLKLWLIFVYLCKSYKWLSQNSYMSINFCAQINISFKRLILDEGDFEQTDLKINSRTVVVILNLDLNFIIT